MPVTEVVDIRIHPRNETVDDESDSFAAHVDDLMRAIKEDVGELRASTDVVPGKKGGVQEIILALGASGIGVVGAKALVAVLKEWIGRHAGRDVLLEVETADGNWLSLSAKSANLQDVERIVAAGMRRTYRA